MYLSTDVLDIEHPKAQEQVAILICEVGSGFKKSLLSGAMIAVLAGAIGIMVTQAAWAKNLPMGHPSLILTLRAGDDSRFDFFVVDDESIKTLDDEIANKVYNIIETIVLPEIKKQFDEKKEVFLSGYIEYISANYRVDESRLEILIAKQPEEYGCDTEGCHVRIVDVDVSPKLELSQIRQVGMFVAVYETPDRQLVDRIQLKTLDEARILLSEASAVLEEKKNELMADKIPIESFYLRQYEDISRVTILFSPFEPGGPAKEPIDVVDASNTYYKRVPPSTTDPENQFKIRPSDSVTSTAWSSNIHATICPNPVTDPARQQEYDPETGALMDPGSDVEITYYAISPDGTGRSIDTSLYSSTDFCSEAPGTYLAPDVEGNWTIYGIARWVSQGVIVEIESNEVNVLAKPALYRTSSSEVIVPSGPVQMLYDWSRDGKSILGAYYENYTTVLVLMNPESKETRPISLPEQFQGIGYAWFSPSNKEILILANRESDYHMQLFRYNLQDSRLVQLTNDTADHAINSAAWIDSNNIVYSEVSYGQDGSTAAYTIWLAGTDGGKIRKLHERPADQSDGLEITDASRDGKQVLVKISKTAGFPNVISNLTLFSLDTGQFRTLIHPEDTGQARLSPSGDLVLYTQPGGYKTPGGPIVIASVDGTFRERLDTGEIGPADLPVNFVISPNGRSIIALVEAWGGGAYITRTELAHVVPEFGSLVVVIAGAIGVVSSILATRYTFQLRNK